MHSITSRIHRSSPTVIDVDFQITSTVIVTIQFTDHGDATLAKQVVDAYSSNTGKLGFIIEMLRNQAPDLVA